MLQHLGHRPQVSALFGGQLTPGRHLDDVEGVGRHDGWVHVAVIQQVPHDLERIRRSQRWLTGEEPPLKEENGAGRLPAAGA